MILAGALGALLLTQAVAVATASTGADRPFASLTSTQASASPTPAPEAPAAVDEVPAFLSGQNPLGIEVHGFISQGALKTSANNYLGRSRQGTLALSEVGLNFTKGLFDNLRAGIQLFARHLDGTGDFSAKFDWFYLDWRFRDWLGLRAGRLKLPFGLYNEFNDVDSGRVPVLLPEGVYPIGNRDYLLAQIGAELYGYAPIGPVGELSYRLYAGTLAFQSNNAIADGFKQERIDTPYLAGGRLVWDTPLQGLRLAGSAQALRIDAAYVAQPGVPEAFKAAGLAPADWNGRLKLEIPAILWLLSAELARDDLLLTVEYGRWHIRFDSDLGALFPSQSIVREQLYVMGSYRIASLLWPGVYYAALFPDITDRSSTPAHFQHDLALTLRIDLNAYWLLKLEAHYMNGTAYLKSTDNDGAKLDDLRKEWVLFVAKTTLYF